MFSRCKIARIAAVAAFFLMVGAAKPACVLIETLFSLHQEAFSVANDDLGDGEEQEDTSDESGSEDDTFYKILVKGMTLTSSHTLKEQAFTAYLPVFKEHHPEVITPPPKA